MRTKICVETVIDKGSGSGTYVRLLTSRKVLFHNLEATVMTTLPDVGSRSISQRILQHRALPLSQSCRHYTQRVQTIYTNHHFFCTSSSKHKSSKHMDASQCFRNCQKCTELCSYRKFQTSVSLCLYATVLLSFNIRFFPNLAQLKPGSSENHIRTFYLNQRSFLTLQLTLK